MARWEGRWTSGKRPVQIGWCSRLNAEMSAGLPARQVVE
jgi:hypothetical protein